MSSQNTPRYLQLQEEEELSPEFKELISGLPTEKGWFESSHLYLYQYQGFWYQPDHLQALISCRKNFKARDSDVFLVTYPKCGTTWLKAIIFALLNRQDHPPAARNHPLLTHNPHQLVLSLEINLYADANQTSTAVPVPGCRSRRFFSTHMPHVALPESVKSKKCKVVYGCRDPRDAFVSLWHFMNKLRPEGTLEKGIQEALDKFCGGAVGFGPFWDHVLEYWKQSRSREEGSSSVHFVRYEDMKEKPGAHLRRLAEFLDCPFSEEEEGSDSGVVDQILGLTSFERMKSVEVNRSGRLENGMENRHFFRKGEVGDWNNYLSDEMAQNLHHIVQHKLSGSALVL